MFCRHIKQVSWQSLSFLCLAAGLVREKVLGNADRAGKVDAGVADKVTIKILNYSRSNGDDMKVVITAQGNELSSKMDLRFGRARWLIVFDTETECFQAHDNELNLNAAQGAGIQTGRNIANLGADAVITGNVGPNAFKTLSAAKIKVFLAEKQTTQQALDSYRNGDLMEVDQANVEGHWT